MAEKSPVNPPVLQWILEEDGRTYEDIAASAKLSLPNLQAWVEGVDSPTKGELSKLATATKRPRAAFLLPAPPARHSPAAFRRATGSQRQLSNAARQAIRESRQIQKAISWIRQDSSGVAIPQSIQVNDSAELAANAAREWLGISVETQAKWGDDYAALREWREALDDRGILVFSLQIGRKDIRGFSLPDPKVPVVGVNQSGNLPAVRIFSIFHELGHLVRGDSSTCDNFEAEGVSETEVERWCERFAGTFLMPAPDVRQLIGPSSPAGIDEVKRMTRRYRVSARAAAVRLEQLGLAQVGLYSHVNAVFQPRQQATTPTFFSPPRTTARLRQYGPNVLVDVLNFLPARDALATLRIDAVDARALAADLPEIHGY